MLTAHAYLEIFFLFTFTGIVVYTYSAVQSKSNHHYKEDDGKESRPNHVCNGFWICDEEQTRS